MSLESKRCNGSTEIWKALFFISVCVFQFTSVIKPATAQTQSSSWKSSPIKPPDGISKIEEINLAENQKAKIENAAQNLSPSKKDGQSPKELKNEAPRASEKITADELLANYDRIMGPTNFSAEMRMTAFREDGTIRTYSMKALKAGEDKFRIAFYEPSSVSGQEILRVGDNTWLYLPKLKRSSRLANRDSFQGGDFNNSDVLRVNYQKDYSALMAVSELPDTYKIQLKSKNKETSYELIELWFSKANQVPLKGLYYGTSGKVLRSAIFKNLKIFGLDYQRPALVVMKNEVIPTRYSELEFMKIDIRANIPPQKFLQTDLGRP